MLEEIILIRASSCHFVDQKRIIGSENTISSNNYFQVGMLIDLRLIERRIRASVPMDQLDKVRYARYYLADPFLRFYYRMVEPNRTYLAQQNYEPILRGFTEQTRAFVAAAFEDICREWTLLMGRAGELPFTPDYVGSDWRGQELQIDVMAVNFGRYIWRCSPGVALLPRSSLRPKQTARAC